MAKLTCTSCNGSTPPDGITIVGSRRTVKRRPGIPDSVLYARSVSQTCPSCAEVSRSENLEIKCLEPPLLEIEYESTMAYLRGTLPLIKKDRIPGCSICSEPIASHIPFVELSIATEWYAWRLRRIESAALDPEFHEWLLQKSKFGSSETLSDPRPQIRWERLIYACDRVVFAEICGNCSDHYWSIGDGTHEIIVKFNL